MNDENGAQNTEIKKEFTDEHAEMQRREGRFRILVCIDGTDESYRGLKYAVKLAGDDSDIVLLYVRPFEQGIRSGGLQIDMARENMLEWGIELPGMKYLKKARDVLLELGAMESNWHAENFHTDVKGSARGDWKSVFIGPKGQQVVMKLKVARDIASGILDQYELGPYDIIILGASTRWGGMFKTFWDPAVAEKVAVHAHCSVLVARDLEVGNGHLVCVDGSENSLDMVRREGEISLRCKCPISLMSISHDVEGEADAKSAVDLAEKVLNDMGVTVKEKLTKVGNPVETIIETGPDYSVIVMSDTGKTGLKRFFMGSVAFKVMEDAYTSVMIVRS